jgi:flagellar assembly protein FliH
MGAPAKFLFDADFSEKAAKAKPATPAEISAQISEAATSGYARGFAAAQREAEASDARRMAIALEQIGQAVATVVAGLDTIERRVETEATEVAVAVARKLCAELLAREPLAEIAALLEDSLRHLVAAPHLVIRVNDAIYDPAKSRIETLAHRLGFEGRLVILAEPELGTGDCRIEWADGSIARDRAATDARIGELIGRYLASRRDGSPKHEGETHE